MKQEKQVHKQEMSSLTAGTPAPIIERDSLLKAKQTQELQD